MYDALSGTLKYETSFSLEDLNNSPGFEECTLNAIGLGIGLSGEKRVMIVGMGGFSHAVIYGNNPETGANYYVKDFPIVDTDGYTLAKPNTGYGEWSSVGNFISNRSDQLRVTYFRGNINGPVDVKITYYNVLTGNQIGNTIALTLPAPVLPTP